MSITLTRCPACGLSSTFVKCAHRNICIVHQVPETKDEYPDLGPQKIYVECSDCKEVLPIETVEVRYEKVELITEEENKGWKEFWEDRDEQRKHWESFPGFKEWLKTRGVPYREETRPTFIITITGSEGYITEEE